MYCHPLNYQPLSSVLYHNNGDGPFSDASARSGIAALEGNGLSDVVGDYDGDGLLDLVIVTEGQGLTRRTPFRK